MTLGMIDDLRFQCVTAIGVVGPDKGKGGKCLLLPPGCEGEVPKGDAIRTRVWRPISAVPRMSFSALWHRSARSGKGTHVPSVSACFSRRPR